MNLKIHTISLIFKRYCGINIQIIGENTMQLNERALPLYVQKDIEALKAYHRGELNHPEDCLYMEFYGSINAAQHDFEISKEAADYLRVKYLGMENGVDVEYYFETHSIFSEMVGKKLFIEAIPKDKIALFNDSIDGIYEYYVKSDGRLTVKNFISERIEARIAMQEMEKVLDRPEVMMNSSL